MPTITQAAPQAVPHLQFDNGTPFAAMQFNVRGQDGAPFHVFVAKTGFALTACNSAGEAQLVPLRDPAPLLHQDRHYDDDPAQGVCQEDDLAPHKPRCDVTVVATAHAPRGGPLPRFDVGLRVQRPGRPVPPPPRPQGLNQFAEPSAAELTAWRERLQRLRGETIPGDIAIDKTLFVTGRRALRKMIAPARLLHAGVKLGTLGLVRANPWLLDDPEPFLRLPLRYAAAAGGEARLPPDDSPGAAPARHEACASNPIGLGFGRHWWLDACRPGRLPAPRVEYAAHPFTAGQFWRCANGKPLPEPAGFACIGRSWLPRQALLGQGPNPGDIDPRYWNSAPLDQQCALAGDEWFTLANLCPHDSPLARANADGDTILRFTLPRQALYIVVTDAEGGVAIVDCNIDTIFVDPEAARVELTWRLRLPANGGPRSALLMHADREDQLRRLKLMQETQATFLEAN